MVHPTLDTTSDRPDSVDADVLVLGVRPGSDGSPAVVAPTADGTVVDLGIDLAALGVRGTKDQLVRLPAPGLAARSVALIGLGSRVDAASIRAAAGSAVRQLHDVVSIALGLPTDHEDLVDAALEGAALGTYTFTRHRGTGTTGPVRGDQRITVLAAAPAEATVRPAIVADAVALVRDLVNTAAADMAPEDVAEAALDAARGLPSTSRCSTSPRSRSRATAGSSGSAAAPSGRPGSWSCGTRPTERRSTSRSWARASPSTPGVSR